MNKIKNLIKDKNLWLCLLIVIIFLAGLSRLEYSRCTYRMYSDDYTVEYEHYFTIGRYIVALAWKLVNVLGFSIHQTYFCTYLLSIIFLTFSMYEMVNITKKFTNNPIFHFIIATLIIITPFIFDLLIYLEKGISMLALCTTIYATSNILNYFETKKKKYLIYSILLLLISVFSYQGTTPLFICISLVFILKYSSNITTFIKNNIIVALCFAIPYLFNYICIKFYKTSVRLSGEIDIKASIQKIASLMPNMIIDTYNTMPKYIFILTFILLLLIYISYHIYISSKKINEINNSKSKMEIKKENSKKIQLDLLLNFFGYFYIIILIFFITIAPQLVLDYKYIQLVPRSSLTFGTIIGILMLYYFSVNMPNKFFKNLLTTISGVYLCIELIWITNLIQDHYIVNYLDKETVLNIQHEIEEYESETGIEIKYIQYYCDSNLTRTYPNIIGYNEINEKVASMYSNIKLLNYYSNRNYSLTTEKEIQDFKEFFSNNDWNYFNIEQIKFDGDTVHICQF